MLSSEASQKCQSRYYKHHNPDSLADYNSLNDRHLKYYNQHPGRKLQLMRAQKVALDGRVIDEKEWRRMNLEWERRRRDAREEESSRRRREENERRHRMELRQKAKDEETSRRRVEERRRTERVGMAGTREGWVNSKGPRDLGGKQVLN